MQRSGSQKFLLVVSVITIILSIFIIISGVVINVAGGFFGGTSEAVELANSLSDETGTAITSSQIGGIATFTGMLMIINGIVDLILGILGVRAANDNQKIMPVWVLALISLVLDAIGIVMMLVNGPLDANNILTALVGLACSALLFWVANNIKKQAGR